MIKLLDIHVCLMTHLFAYFPSRAMAYKVVSGMVDRCEIKHSGYMRGTTGHPSRWICNWKPEEDKLSHELGLTDVLLWYESGAEIVRGYEVDEDILPDAEMTIDGELHHVEFDTGSMRGQKIDDRLAVYDGIRDDVLWIVKSDQRRKNLQQKTKNENAYFGVYAEIMDNPYGPVWENRYGEQLSLG